MGHKIPFLSSLLVTCHLSSRLYGVRMLSIFIETDYNLKKITAVFFESCFKRIPFSRYIDAKEPIREKLLFLSPICSRKGAYPPKTKTCGEEIL